MLKNNQHRILILYLLKILFMNECEANIFLDKSKLREFITAIPN